MTVHANIFAFTGADLAYWERKRRRRLPLRRGSTDRGRPDYILSQWHLGASSH